jgi:nucleoside 2-deoxyribosyltransferase
MSLNKCPVCKAPAVVNLDARVNLFSFNCYRCGMFQLEPTGRAPLERNKWSEQQIATASCYIRRNQGLSLTKTEVERLAGLPIPSPTEKAARLLVYLGQSCPQPGAMFEVSAAYVSGALRKLDAHASEDFYPDNLLEPTEVNSLEWLAIAAASNGTEAHWLLESALVGSGYLEEGRSFIYDGRGYPSLIITPSGWQEIERLKQVNIASSIGFVAMSFRDEFIPFYDQGIAQGIAAAGYESRRVDRTEHNNRIDDEIIASIKQSRFLVADFTLNRGGIYFEAGLALGLGLPVIWLVREDQIGEVHFDNRQYNFIMWKDGEWDDFAKRLRFRIESTIGRGPITGS